VRKLSNTIESYKNYLRKYPNGKYANEAKSKIDELISQEKEDGFTQQNVKQEIKSLSSTEYIKDILEDIYNPERAFYNIFGSKLYYGKFIVSVILLSFIIKIFGLLPHNNNNIFENIVIVFFLTIISLLIAFFVKVFMHVFFNVPILSFIDWIHLKITKKHMDFMHVIIYESLLDIFIRTLIGILIVISTS